MHLNVEGLRPWLRLVIPGIAVLPVVTHSEQSPSLIWALSLNNHRCIGYIVVISKRLKKNHERIRRHKDEGLGLTLSLPVTHICLYFSTVYNDTLVAKGLKVEQKRERARLCFLQKVRAEWKSIVQRGTFVTFQNRHSEFSGISLLTSFACWVCLLRRTPHLDRCNSIQN